MYSVVSSSIFLYQQSLVFGLSSDDGAHKDQAAEKRPVGHHPLKGVNRGWLVLAIAHETVVLRVCPVER